MCPINRDSLSIEREAVQVPSASRQPPDQVKDGVLQNSVQDFSPTIRYPELEGISQDRMLYRADPRRQYTLRQSEVYTLVENGES